MPPVFRLAVALVVLALATPGAQQREADTESQQPTFRAGVNVVRVDVSVTGRNDEAIETLDASSFRVTEDGVPQKVETAQFIRLTGEPDGSGRDLTVRDREHGLAEAEKDDVRLFALFLDDYHIDSHPEVAQRLKRALESFVDALRPTDLVVVMDPLTTLEGLTFTRDKWLLRERIRTFKGRRGELVPVRSVLEEAQLSQRNVWELRAGVTLSALEALVTHLGGLREGRKSVIFVSQGPPVGRPRQSRVPATGVRRFGRPIAGTSRCTSSILVRWGRLRLAVPRRSRASRSTPEGGPSSTATHRGTGSRKCSPMPAPTI